MADTNSTTTTTTPEATAPPATPTPTTAPDDISAIVAKAVEEALKKNEPPPKDPTTLEQIEAERKAAEKAAADRKAIEEDVKFSTGLPAFVEAHKKHLGENATAIIAKIEASDATSAEKVNAIKYNLAADFFATKENLETLSPTMRARIEKFNAMDASTSAGLKKREGFAASAFEAMEQVLTNRATHDKHSATLNGTGGGGYRSEAHEKYIKRNFSGSLLREVK